MNRDVRPLNERLSELCQVIGARNIEVKFGSRVVYRAAVESLAEYHAAMGPLLAAALEGFEP